MDNINFTASFVKSTSIKKLKNNRYKPHQASLVELNPYNKNDLKAILKTADKWESSLTEYIHEDMEKVHNQKIPKDMIHVFAITRQKDKYEKLSPSKILGVIEMKEDPSVGHKIDILQTNTNYIRHKNYNKTPKYKHIGQELVTFIKDRFSDDNIYLSPVESAIPFYEKQGFTWMFKNNDVNVLWIPKR